MSLTSSALDITFYDRESRDCLGKVLLLAQKVRIGRNDAEEPLNQFATEKGQKSKKRDQATFHEGVLIESD
jgi:hypothetical protein